MTSVRPPLWLAAMLFVAVAAAHARAERIESYEGPEVSWRFLSSDASPRIERHERAADDPHSGETCERLRVVCGSGASCYFGHPLGPARLIDELAPRVWVKSDRLGLRLSARVVFPRSLDPTTGRALSTLVHGDSLGQRGAWQQLGIPPLGPLVKAQLRVLRSQLGRDIDPREAYVDLLVVNVFSGPGPINVWFDDLDCEGLIRLEAVAATRAATELPIGSPSQSASPSLPRETAPPSQPTRSVRLRSGLLLAEERPIFPCVVEYRGEPLEHLRSIGFQAIRLAEMPGPELIDEARQAGLWLVLPANSNIEAAARRGSWPVLAYAHGPGASAQEMASISPRDRPPIVGSPAPSSEIGRLENHPLLGGKTWSTHFQALRQIVAQAPPNAPLWATLPTEPEAALAAQWTRFDGASDPRWSISPEQIRLLAYMNLAGGARGFDFPSQTPLIGRGPAARWRQASLEILLTEWKLLAPWGAAGTPLAAWQHDAETFLAMWSIERAILVVVIRAPAESQKVADAPGTQPLRVMIPGAAENADAWQLGAAGLRPLAKQRVAGGIEVTIDNVGHAAAVVITSDPLVQGSLARQIAADLPRVARLEQELALLAAAEMEPLTRRANASPYPLPGADAALAEARQLARQAAELAAAGDFAAAVTVARRSRGALARLARVYWERMQASRPRHSSHPLAASFPTAIRLGELPASTPPSAIQPIAGGNGEQIASLPQADWWVQGKADGSGVEPSPRAAHSGEQGLRVYVKSPGSALDFSSAAARVGEKRLICLRGWVRTPAALAGDGLLLKLSGDSPALTLPIRYAPRWQPFEIHRAVATATELRLLGHLESPGEVWLDDLELVDLGPLPEPSRGYEQIRLERLPAP